MVFNDCFITNPPPFLLSQESTGAGRIFAVMLAVFFFSAPSFGEDVLRDKPQWDTPRSILLIEEQKKAIEGADPFMGDWQGSWRYNDGSDSNLLVAQVIAWGKGKYQANMLEGFDKRIPPAVVLEGQRDNQARQGEGPAVVPTIRLAGQGKDEHSELQVKAVIEAGKFTGSFQTKNQEGKEQSGSFMLEKVYRISPTLGKEPPAGAIVLFDGKNFDQWQHVGTFAGLISIAEVLGSCDNSVAYLRSNIWSATNQSAILELGSDDGIKVWLNGQLIHANNVMRGLVPAQDKVGITLSAGWSVLMLKITNGGGGWAACARLVGEDRQKIENIKEKIVNGKDTDEYLKKNDGFITIWEIAGPYQQQGKDGTALFDVVFEPEKLVSAEARRAVAGSDATSVQYKQVNLNKPKAEKVRWKLVDGAMEVKPGAGSLITKREFKDIELHLEFRTPFMPDARGQGRGNSGVYLQGRYEVQVLDSYGLEGRDNECGGIYKVAAPLVNMCAPPLQWQTYDIIFRAPHIDKFSNKVENACITVLHNGVTIHENLQLDKPTTAALYGDDAQAGPIFLQDHGNPVQYRNIWLVELPTESNVP